MKHRITRKMPLGLLMALVLAFSVQGNPADALTFSTSRSGDLETKAPNGKFTIRFTVNLKTPVRNPTYKDYKQTPSASVEASTVANKANKNTYYDDTGDTGYQSETQVTYDTVYHYDQEVININLDGDARIVKVGSRDVNLAAGDHKMYERSHNSYEGASDHQKLSGSVTLVIEATGVAGDVITVKVTDDTDGGDVPSGDSGKSPPITFTLYSVKYQSALTSTNNVTTLVGDGVEYAFDNDIRPLSSYFTFVQDAEVPVHYSIAGSGTLLIRKTYGDGSPASVKTASKTLPTSSSAPVFIDMKKGTSKVTTWVSGGVPRTMIFIYQGGTPNKYPEIERTQGNNQTGAVQGRLEESLAVKVTDGNNRALSGLAVSFTTTSGSESKFIPVSGTRVYGSGSTLTQNLSPGAYVDNTSATTEATANQPNAGDVIFVQTDSNGVAQAYYQLGNSTGPYQVTAALAGIATGAFPQSKIFDATAVAAGRSASLVIVSGDNQQSDATTHDVANPLVVRVRRPGGYRISDVRIRFTALTGVLEPASGHEAVAGPGVEDANKLTSGQEIFVDTNAHGEAGVIYNVGQLAGAKTVTARVDDEEATTQYDFQIRQVVFNINEEPEPEPEPDPAPDPAPQPPPKTIVVAPPEPRLIIEPASIVGTPGSTHQITVRAVDAKNIAVSVPSVAVGNLAFEQAGGSFNPGTVITPITGILTLPNTPARYEVSAAAKDYKTATASVRVAKGTLRITVPSQGPPGKADTLRVTAREPAGDAPEGLTITLSVTGNGGSFAASTLTTNPSGYQTTTFTRGSTPGTDYFIRATAPGYTDADIRIVISGTPAPTTTPTTSTTAADLDVYSGNQQTGSPNSALPEPLVVEVVDANDNPVENARVRFRTTIGSGRFSPRTPRTDAEGLAETTFTPTSAGRIRIVATVAGVNRTAGFNVQGGEPAAALVKVSGDTQNGSPGKALSSPFVVEVRDADGDPLAGHTVTFSVTAGGGSLSATSDVSDAKGRAETTLTLGSQRGVNSVRASVTGTDPTTFNTSIAARILVAAANRPVMYWIADGALYRLAGAKEVKIADSANGVAIDGNKLYYTTQTGPSAGTISAANLDGSGASVLARIRAVPMGIGVSGDKLYWTNSRGRVQSANLNGSGIQNMVENRSGATDVVVHGGFVYWTQGGTAIHRVNTTGRKVIADVAVSLSNVGGIAVGGDKVYWTERTGVSAGTVNGANLDGTQFKTLATLKAAPMGISVDTAGSKLYWTNSRGRVQRANLNGSKIQNVVDGLISPSTLVIGGANTATAAKPTTQPTETQPPKKDTAKYDVNGDGTVDNVDASLVSTAMGTTTAKYDVNDDGTVNFLDLLLVFDNRDDGAAGAPTVLGIQLSSVQIAVIEEQIDLLIATGDRSPSAMRTLVYLQQLIATARPEKTQLLANYPNPFNPETWIPYELATDTEVRITIYNTQGVVIRTLTLGHQAVGYYTGRDRAAYWDGRNALGEQVASGIYFYQLETDEMSSLRKMVILK